MKKQSKGNETFGESTGRKPPKIISSTGIKSFVNASKTKREEDKKERTAAVNKMEKVFDGSKGISASRQVETQRDVISNSISEIHGNGNNEMVKELQIGPIIEDQLQEAQALNLGHSFSFNEKVTVNASEGDAKEPTINESTPHSVNGQHHADITKDLVKQGDRTAKCPVTVTSKQLSEKTRNLGNIYYGQ